MAVCPVLLYASENEQVTVRKHAGNTLAYIMQSDVRAGYFYLHKGAYGDDGGKLWGHKMMMEGTGTAMTAEMMKQYGGVLTGTEKKVKKF